MSNNIENIKKYIKSLKNYIFVSHTNVSNNKYIIIINDIKLNNNIKIFTDFNSYCYLEDNIKHSYITNFNINIILTKINLNNIILNFNKYLINHIINSEITLNFNTYNITLENHNFNDKYSINVNLYFKQFYNVEKNNDSIKIIINEIKKINSNHDYKHYIIIKDYNKPLNLTVRLVFNKNENMYDILQQIYADNKYDYIEFNLLLNTNYPYSNPDIEYLKPTISSELLLGILNINIFKSSNWNYIITLEDIILGIANNFNEFGYKYINTCSEFNNKEIAFDKLEYNIINLISIINIENSTLINFDIKIDNKQNNKSYSTGIGYNNTHIIKLNNANDKNLIKKNKIYHLINNILNIIGDDYIYFNDTIKKSIVHYIYEYNIFEVVNNIDNFNSLLLLLKIFIMNDSTFFNKDIYDKLYFFLFNLKEEIQIIIKCDIDNNIINKVIVNIEIILNYISDQCKVIHIEKQHSLKVINYLDEMKKIQLLTFEINNSHRFFNKKSEPINKKTIKRIMSELISLKTTLPLNLDSTVWLRYCEQNINILTFIISGPKNTPYENGLFEFHVYIPFNYPLEPPHILLHNTGNGSVRFNPNLYNCGKVCLSLLNTWTGDDNEKWNENSTLLQVIISIQSFILIEKPFFNEPGFLNLLGTNKGELDSKKYNDELYNNTIKFAINEIIKNPSDEVVKIHFEYKKKDILNTLNKWLLTCGDEYKSNIFNSINEFKNLMHLNS